MQIHTFCSKADLDFYNGKHYIDNEWKNRMIILVKILIPLYEDKNCRSPLIFYVCDDKQGSSVLRSKKPFNEKDLIDALKKGSIWGAGLDVTNPEPMKPDNPLLVMENVCILPHIGSATIEARNEMSRMAAENIISYFKNNTIPNCVNPEVLKKHV